MTTRLPPEIARHRRRAGSADGQAQRRVCILRPHVGPALVGAAELDRWTRGALLCRDAVLEAPVILRDAGQRTALRVVAISVAVSFSDCGACGAAGGAGCGYSI